MSVSNRAMFLEHFEAYSCGAMTVNNVLQAVEMPVTRNNRRYLQAIMRREVLRVVQAANEEIKEMNHPIFDPVIGDWKRMSISEKNKYK